MALQILSPNRGSGEGDSDQEESRVLDVAVQRCSVPGRGNSLCKDLAVRDFGGIEGLNRGRKGVVQEGIVGAEHMGP